MKEWKFEINSIVLGSFFPKERMDKKIQIIVILLETTRYILNNPPLPTSNSKFYITLLVDKMSRLFFVSENKVYSIVFPFKISNDVSENKFSILYENYEIDSKIISNMLTIIKDDRFSKTCLLGFVDFLEKDGISEDNEAWFILKELILKEDGYIRYDIDSLGYKRAEKEGRADRHPLHHFDLFYSNNSTFKIGLRKEITIEQFIDLLNIKTDCKYLDY